MLTPILLDEDNHLNGYRSQMLNLSAGGQNGAMMVPQEVMNNAPYVKQRIIPVLLTVPGGYQYFDNPQAWARALRHLIEVQKQRIEGLNATVNWEYSQRQIGNSGEVFDAPVRGSREVSKPTFTWAEGRANSITRYFDYHGRMLIMDPDLGQPGLIALPKYIAAGSPPILPEMQSFAVMYIESDETLTRPVNVWILANHMPNTAGEVTGTFETHYTGQVQEVAIEFTSVATAPSALGYKFAANYLKSMNLRGLVPSESVPMYKEISAAVAAAGTGFADKIDAVTGTFR